MRRGIKRFRFHNILKKKKTAPSLPCIKVCAPISTSHMLHITSTGIKCSKPLTDSKFETWVWKEQERSARQAHCTQACLVSGNSSLRDLLLTPALKALQVKKKKRNTFKMLLKVYKAVSGMYIPDFSCIMTWSSLIKWGCLQLLKQTSCWCEVHIPIHAGVWLAIMYVWDVAWLSVVNREPFLYVQH